MRETLTQRAARLLDRAYPLVAVDGDTERDRIRKSITVVVGTGGVVMTSLTAILATLVGVPTPFSVGLFLYAGLIAVALGAFVVTKRGMGTAIAVMMAGNLAISWFGTWYQGGVADSGANILWGILAPIVAMLAFGRKVGLWWFGAFFAILMAAIFVRRSGAPEPSDGLVLGNFAIVLGGVTIFLFFLFVYFVRERDRAQDEADRERARSDALLLNILPDEIVARLKDGERVIADRFDDATILFADIAGFTPMSATMEPVELVELLNDVFTEFDELAARYGVEKIKTIGDAYMVAAGVPVPRADHAEVLADLALEMNALVAARRFMGRDIRFRIGINSGPVVAGVIGEQKFIYDLWGDAVNVASRMESNGAAGRIQITETTRQHLDGRYDVVPGGTVDVKGKGPMRVYFIEGRVNDRLPS
jgi:guanylate cyclase